MPTPTDRPEAMPTSTSTETATTYFQLDKFLPLYIFPRLAFMIIIFSFSYFLLHMVFANYSSKWNYSYATFSILIKTAKQFCSSSNSSFDIFVCLRKCWRENLSWLLRKEIKCILSEINFIAALSERGKKKGGREREAPQKTTRLEYGLESALISLLQFYLIALIRNYVYAMLRQALKHRAKLSSALSASGIRPAKRRWREHRQWYQQQRRLQK